MEFTKLLCVRGWECGADPAPWVMLPVAWVEPSPQVKGIKIETGQ